jgi:hypothetical protein
MEAANRGLPKVRAITALMGGCSDTQPPMAKAAAMPSVLLTILQLLQK